MFQHLTFDEQVTSETELTEKRRRLLFELSMLATANPYAVTGYARNVGCRVVVAEMHCDETCPSEFQDSPLHEVAYVFALDMCIRLFRQNDDDECEVVILDDESVPLHIRDHLLVAN